MGAGVAPLRVSSVLCGLRQGGEGSSVIALQLPNLQINIISAPSILQVAVIESPGYNTLTSRARLKASVQVSRDSSLVAAAHPREPPAVGLDVGGVAQLSARPRPNDHLLDRCAQVMREVVPEGAHEVGVALHGAAARQHARGLVRKDGHVLAVALAQPRVARPVCEEDVGVLLPGLRTRA